MFSEIKKHIKIYLHLAKLSIMEQMEYRMNFVLGIIVECTWLASKMLYVLITQKAGGVIGGLSPDQIMLFVGTFMIMTGIYIGLFSGGFHFVSRGVLRGELDMLIVKPVSLQFITTMRYVRISVPIPNTIAGVTFICIAWNRMGLSAGFINILLFLYLIISGTVIIYCIFLIPHMFAFFTVKVRSITEVAYRLWDFNNMPMQIYNRWWKRIGVFFIPIFVITNFPVMALFDNLPLLYLVWGLILPVVLFVAVRLFWNFSVKRYSSAGG